MIIMKFGGSSVADEQKINNVAEIVKSKAAENPVVIVSALGGVTDSLLKTAKLSQSSDWKEAAQKVISRHRNVLHSLRLEDSMLDEDFSELESAFSSISSKKQLSQSALDLAASFGERMSSKIVAACIRSKGMECAAYNAYDLGMVTDSNFGNADILPETYSAIKREFSRIGKGIIPVITGYIGKDRNGEITTLGRGGSDYTASIIGAATGAEEIQIWTDVNGIMTADPNVVKDARNIKEFSYQEEAELEFLGAKTLHPKGILPAMQHGIPVAVLNTMNPSGAGTRICNDISEESRIASITSRAGIDAIILLKSDMRAGEDTMHQAIGILKEHRIGVDLILTSRSTITIAIDNAPAQELDEALKELNVICEAKLKAGLSKVSLVGKSIGSIPGINARILSSVKDLSISAVSFGGSENSESFIVKQEDAEKAVRQLHREFF